MISSSADACDWCRRPFDTFFDARAGIKRVAPQKQGIPAVVKVAGSVAAIVFAVFSLAHIKTAPDAAQIGNVGVAPHGAVARSVSTRANTSSPAPPPAQNITSAPAVSLPPTSPYSSGTMNTGIAPAMQSAQEKPAAKLASVQISTQVDANGNETAVGTVVIVNESPYDISDFSLSLEVGGVPTTLIPFEGTANYPMPLQRNVVPAHGNLQVSVMSAHSYLTPPSSVRNVKLVARFHGTDQDASDTVRLGSSG